MSSLLFRLVPYEDKTFMLFGNAKGFAGDIVRELTGGGGH